MRGCLRGRREFFAPRFGWAIGLRYTGLRSSGFRDWLIDGYMNGQSVPPSSWAIRRVVGMLEARARFTTGMPQVFVRVGQETDGDETAYFRDLGDSSGAAVEIRDRGWSVVDRPGVHFRRPAGLLPLPSPARDGSIDLWRRYVNLTEPDFRLMVGSLTAALRPVGPYPVLYQDIMKLSGTTSLGPLAQNDQHVRHRTAPDRSPASASWALHQFRAARRQPRHRHHLRRSRHGSGVGWRHSPEIAAVVSILLISQAPRRNLKLYNEMWPRLRFWRGLFAGALCARCSETGVAAIAAPVQPTKPA